jgi:DNA polymerase III delta prime subunit
MSAVDVSKNLFEVLDQPSHHAYLVLGDTSNNFDSIRLFFRKKISAGKILSADVSTQAYENLSIDEARSIVETQNTMPIGEKRFMLISLDSIQHEAQNSLLKIFEEATHTVFIICARHSSLFLPTLLSRFYSIEAGDGRGNETSNVNQFSATDFLSQNISNRLKLLEPIIKEKDKTLTENFLNDLETALYKVVTNSKAISSSPEKMEIATAVFEDIFSSRRFLRSRSASVKMILEHLAGTVPRMDIKIRTQS